MNEHCFTIKHGLEHKMLINLRYFNMQNISTLKIIFKKNKKKL